MFGILTSNCDITTTKTFVLERKVRGETRAWTLFTPHSCCCCCCCCCFCVCCGKCRITHLVVTTSCHWCPHSPSSADWPALEVSQPPGRPPDWLSIITKRLLTDSLLTPYWLLTESWQTPYWLLTDSLQTPYRLPTVHTNSLQTPYRLLTDSLLSPYKFLTNSLKTPYRHPGGERRAHENK